MLTTTTSGSKSEIVSRMFKAGESMNVDNFVKFYTDDALYQFSNFPIVYGPQGIKDASVTFIETVEQVYHHIKNMWEVGDTVICEMEVTYIRFDGKVFTLPCCDTIRIKGDKVQELRIYMDISAVFAKDSTPNGNGKVSSEKSSGVLLEVSQKSSGSLSQVSAKTSGKNIDIVKRMFKAGESMNVDNFVKFYTDDALYQFSNFPIVYGPQGIKDASVTFIETVEQVYHHIKNIWEVDEDTVVCEMEVTYIRFDGKVFTLPCCDTIRIKGDKVQELRIYMDISAVFAKDSTPNGNGKVSSEKSSGVLLEVSQKSSGSLSEIVGRMIEVLMAEKWDEFLPFFSENLLYKVGANDSLIGPEACRDFLASLYTTIKPTAYDLRGAWEVGNVVIVEMDANYIHINDRRVIQVPCTDVYRFDGNLIREWRVYADASQVEAKKEYAVNAR